MAANTQSNKTGTVCALKKARIILIKYRRDNEINIGTITPANGIYYTLQYYYMILYT